MDRLTPSQIRGARGMLNWSLTDLAKASRLSVSTIKRMETVGPPEVSVSAFATARTALESAGIRFISDADKSEGLWLDHG